MKAQLRFGWDLSFRQQIVLAGIITSVIFVAISIARPNKVFAGGGIGSGGSGSGGGTSGSFNTRNGWSWALYDVNGFGPSAGFRDGTPWGNVVGTCRGGNASHIAIYVIAGPNGAHKGYNFTQDPNVPFQGQYSSGTVIDNGRATAIPTRWAQDGFNSLPVNGVSTAGYTFGGDNGNVSWFCAGIGQGNRPNNPVGQADAECNAGFRGWSADADNLSASLAVAIVVKQQGIASWNDSANLILTFTADQVIPEPPFNRANLFAFGVAGNKGFTVPIPEAYKNNSGYDWIALAGDAPGNNYNPNVFSVLGQGSFACPPTISWDVGVSVTCDINRGTALFSFSKMGNIDGNVEVTRNINLQNPNRAVLNVTDTYNDSTWPTSSIVEKIVPDPVLGQTMTASISVNRGGSGGLNNSSNDSVTCPTTEAKSYKPYFRVYGGDVVVGRNFAKPGGTCNKEPNKEILAYTDNISGWVGAGTQFAASATGKIEDFMSASMHSGVGAGVNAVPKPPKDLSFLNTTTPIGNDDSAYRGCVPDYEAYVNSDGGWSTPPAGSVNQGSLSTNAGNKLYINGNLNITGDIKDDSRSWNSIDEIEPIIVIVKGNINIAPNVTRLDGLYVAMPSGKDPNTGEILGGVINTCTPVTSQCVDKQLVINGAFVAKQVKLMRLKGDVYKASTNEQNGSTNIAEIFNFPTELYLGLKYQNIAPTTPNATRKDYDTIVGLPPIL